MTAEASLREQLALACRMLVNEGLLDQSGHISARLRDDPSTFLIHPHRLRRYEVTADKLVTVNLDGQPLHGQDRPRRSIRTRATLTRWPGGRPWQPRSAKPVRA
jgi:ribulose-5-phosphate 4-epimerase/fuculose-1-phosphate aldolase